MTEPTAPRYRYAARYYIADAFGDILWSGSFTFGQDAPWPTDERDDALLTARTAKLIRKTAPPDAPEGKILIAAITPI